jgi:Tol biopolymer transport system component
VAIASSVGLLALTAAACSGDTRGATATTSGATASPATANPTQRNGQIAFELLNKTPYESVVSIMNPDGTGVVTLASPVPFESPQWSPDGNSIAGKAPGSGTLAGQVVNVDTGAVVDIPNSGGVYMDCFVWRPDAQRLACDSLNSADQNHGIYTVRASDWTDLRKVTADPVLDDNPGSYSPDGKRIVFARFIHDGAPVGLFVINADGTGLKQITPPGALVGGNKWGDWSPQGDEIVFAQGDNADARASIWVVHADGTGLHEIHFDSPIPCGGPKADPNSRGCFDATWSPDGKKIAFIVNEPSGEGRSVYTANIDGSNLTQLTHGNSGDPDWGTRPPT